MLRKRGLQLGVVTLNPCGGVNGHTRPQAVFMGDSAQPGGKVVLVEDLYRGNPVTLQDLTPIEGGTIPKTNSGHIFSLP
jgi:hypothetical protein